ncbi:MAG: ABC transporter substrate-binding protein [Anaerolineae bacterium]|nr:ABC transporter substrate-binding protein [Anaerolineae bacterium]NUQ03178.1 peptide ABC transporter substrate-binding protein [Anaerolineae bacterium]
MVKRFGLGMLLILVFVALSVPVLAQDAPANMTVSDSGLITYAAESCDYGGEILSIEAVDETTVKFTLCYADPAFPSKVAFAAFGIRSSDQLEVTGGGGDLLSTPIGTGPYMLDHWDLGNEIVLARNDSYWGDAAIESTLIFRWNSESAQRLTELQAGNVSAIDNPGALDIPVVQGDPNLQFLPREGTNVFYVGMNNTIAPFDNVKVRQAVAYGVDKQRIVDQFYPPGSSVADQFMPTSIFGYTPEVEPFPYDPEMARQLLEEAAAEGGFSLPIETTISYRDVVRGYLPSPGVVAADLQQQLAAIGINLTIEVQESGTFLDNASAGRLPIFLLGWGADYPDATNFLDFHFGVGANDSFGTKHPEITEPLQAGARLADFAERYPYYIEANTAIRDLVPMLPVAHGGSGIAYKAGVAGAHTSPLGNENFSVMDDPTSDTFVWMQNAEPISMYCSDETDGESLRACEQVIESLLAYEVGGTAVVPSLAETYEASEDLTEWTFHLRPGVTFHDGSALDSNDVVMTFAVQWDAANPLHVGRSGAFDYFSGFFAAFLNAPES